MIERPMQPRHHDDDANEDPFELKRFLEAQADQYDAALAELRAGFKQSHWMWYIFPQLRGLGRSETARFFGLSGVDEARAFLSHAVLGPRLKAACEALLTVPQRSATEILGTPDDLKLRSSATLFASISRPGSVFHRVLDRFFESAPDPMTIQAIERREA